MIKFSIELCSRFKKSSAGSSIFGSLGVCFAVSGGLVLFNGSGFAKEQAKGTMKLALSGSSTIAPLASDLAKAFEKKFPGSRLDVQSGGSSKGLSDVRSKLSDIGMVSRDLTEKESDLRGTPIAYDGIAMIAHKDNPVAELNDKQIVSIYTGKITNWKELGGADHPITVVNKAEGRSTLELFLQFFSLKNVDIKAQMIVGENEQAIKFVGGSKWALGYVSVGTAEYASKVSKTIKTLRLNGIDATLVNVKNKTYPLRRTLNFVNLEPSSEGTKSFLSFVKDSEAKKLIEDHYFVPL
jgi:phosphate transport system substrate-binding protein